MDSQQGTFGAEGAHCITIEEPSLLEKGEDKLGETGDQAEEERYVNTNEVIDSQEDISSVEIHHAQLIKEEQSLKGKPGESEEAEIETDVNTGEEMNSQEDTPSLTSSHGIPIEEQLIWEKMNRKLTSKLRTADDSQEVTIFRVPLKIRENNKNMFEPSVVSIGPYHRGRPHLRAMEEKKWSLLQNFLNRTERSLEDCISKIKEVEERARFCYSDPFDMSSDDFVEMMVLDGCFILEYFYKIQETEDFQAITEGWNFFMTATDLILLENQIPYFIIETLLGSSLNPQKLMHIADVLTWQKLPIKTPSHPQKIYHMLHLCLCHAVPNHSKEPAASEPNQRPFFNLVRTIPVSKYFWSEKEEELDESVAWAIPCATELEEAGVKFKRLEQYDDITKITFKSGTLVIPRIHVSDTVKPLFMNLVVLEQCMFFRLPLHFSTYITFLDKLVNTPHDVKILQKKGILESMLSSEEEVALFLNQSCVDVTIPPNHYLVELFKRVNKYCESRYHRYRAKLSRDYFNTPWSIIALIAATLLLCLTIIQSFMSVYVYIRPHP